MIDGAEVGHVSGFFAWAAVLRAFIDHALHQVTFVGIIRNLARNATNVSYNIEDGSGMIDVRAWSDNSSTALMTEDEFK